MRRREGTNINEDDILYEIRKAMRALRRLEERLLAARRTRNRIELKRREQ